MPVIDDVLLVICRRYLFMWYSMIICVRFPIYVLYYKYKWYYTFKIIMNWLDLEFRRSIDQLAISILDLFILFIWFVSYHVSPTYLVNIFYIIKHKLHIHYPHPYMKHQVIKPNCIFLNEHIYPQQALQSLQLHHILF